MIAFIHCRRVIVLIIWCILGLILLIITINDFLFFRIEDENILCLLGLYIISCIFGISGSNFIFGLSIAIIVFVISWVLNQFDMIGGGDVKLMFPLLLFSENNIYEFLLGTSIAGLIISCLYIIFGRKIFLLRRKIINSLKRYKTKNKSNFLNIVLLSLDRISIRSVSLKQYAVSAIKQEIPYGVALACGGFYVIVESWLSRC